MGGTVSEDEVKRYYEQVQISATNAMVERIRELEAEVEAMGIVVNCVHDWVVSNGAPARAVALSEAYEDYRASQRK